MSERWLPATSEMRDPARLSTPIPVATEQDWLADEALMLRRRVARLERENARLRRREAAAAAFVACAAVAVLLLASVAVVGRIGQ